VRCAEFLVPTGPAPPPLIHSSGTSKPPTSNPTDGSDAKHGARAAAPPVGASRDQPGLDVGCTARRQHQRLHQLTATPGSDGALLGHGVRDGHAMITTLRRRLIRVPARLIRHAGALTLRLPPGYTLLDEVLARIRALPATS
jgi:hypothetical protein